MLTTIENCTKCTFPLISIVIFHSNLPYLILCLALCLVRVCVACINSYNTDRSWAFILNAHLTGSVLSVYKSTSFTNHHSHSTAILNTYWQASDKLKLVHVYKLHTFTFTHSRSRLTIFNRLNLLCFWS